MSIKVFKPTTNARRNMSVTDYSELSKVAPEKSLLKPLKKNSGRNSYGRITVRHRGGGNRKKYRVIDFKRTKFDVKGTVKTLEYDPNRSAHIALIEYADGEKAYILAPVGLKVGDTVVAGPTADIKPGNALPLTNIPVGTFVHNVELYPGKGGQLARAAGNAAQLMAKEGVYALLRLPSGELRNVPVQCMATVGRRRSSVGTGEETCGAVGYIRSCNFCGKAVLRFSLYVRNGLLPTPFKVRGIRDRADRGAGFRASLHGFHQSA